MEPHVSDPIANGTSPAATAAPEPLDDPPVQAFAPHGLTKVIFPAVLPQVILALRVCYGIAWVVIVAAEMVGCQDGLGYGIWEARNGLRLDSAVCYMMVIGSLGMGIDRLLSQLTRLPNVRWGYER